MPKYIQGCFLACYLRFLLWFLSSALVACSGSDPGLIDPPEQFLDNYEYQVPIQKGDGWQVGDLDNFTVDKATLVSMMQAINKGEYDGIDSVLMVRHNTLLLDELIRTRLGSRDSLINNQNLSVHSMQSVSKSFASALTGIAIDQGFIASVDTPFYEFFPEYESFENWGQRKADMTLENVLTMRHGWQWDEWTYPYEHEDNSLGETYRAGGDYVKHLLDLPMEYDPGTTFAYSTIASLAIGAAIENSVGMPLEDYADQYLFGPLGITSQQWVLTPTGLPHTGGGLFLSSRDMAKFGQLFLNGGYWNGETIISQAWVKQSTAPHVVTDFGHSDHYAYQWWNKTFELSDGRSIPTFSAQGNGGQFIFVIPQIDAVVVFTGNNYNSAKMYQAIDLMQDYILPATQ